MLWRRLFGPRLWGETEVEAKALIFSWTYDDDARGAVYLLEDVIFSTSSLFTGVLSGRKP